MSVSISSSILIRLGGVAAMVGGLASATLGVVTVLVVTYEIPGSIEKAIRKGSYESPVSIMLLFGALAAIAALHALQRRRYGLQGKLFALGAFIGMVVLPVGWLLAEPSFPFVALIAAVIMSVLAASVGLVGLGIATISAGVLPRWCGAALIAGSPPFVGFEFALFVALGLPAMVPGGIAWALGGVPWVVVGYAIFRATRRPPERPPSEQRPSEPFLRELIVGWQPTRQQVLWAVRIIFAIVVLLSILTLVGSQFEKSKSLWYWLQLLIVPAAITVVGAIVGAWFTQQRARETVLQTYLDKMTELTTDKQLYEKRNPYDPTRVTARARTLATLMQLDGERKKSVVQFLYESQLINKNKKYLSGIEFDARIVGLDGADLTNANLRHLTLEEAALDGAILENADLSNAKLSRIDLGGAFLSAADLRGADLTEASLRNAQLQRKEGLSASKLSGTVTRYTDFWGATMPDGTLFQNTSKAAMRILHVTTELPPFFDGGLGTAVAGLVKASTHEGLTPAVLLLDPHPHGDYGFASSSYSSNGSGAFGNRDYGIAGFLSQHPSLGDEEGGVLPRAGLLVPTPPSEDIYALISRASEWQPDIIHLHSVELWWVADAIKKESRAPLVYTIHSLQLAEYEIGGQLSGLELWPSQQEAIASATRVIVVSESERRLLDQACPEAYAKTRVVGNGVDDATTTEKAERRVAGEQVVVLYVGRFAERKGVRELLQAIPAVLEASDNVRFVLIGGYRHATGAAVAADWGPPAVHDPHTRVHFTGWLPSHEVDTWYRRADILVVPSWYEPLGMVVLEGMMNELPIAASAVGGPSEILVHEKTGLLFEPRNVKALGNAILRLVNDPPLRQRLGTAAAEEVRKRWLWAHVITSVRNVYEEVLAD